MDTETRAAFDETRAAFDRGFDETRVAFDETRVAFARIDRWFELMQAQHVETNKKLSRLEAEFHQFRDWTTVQFADVRGSLAGLMHRFETRGR